MLRNRLSSFARGEEPRYTTAVGVWCAMKASSLAVSHASNSGGSFRSAKACSATSDGVDDTSSMAAHDAFDAAAAQDCVVAETFDGAGHTNSMPDSGNGVSSGPTCSPRCNPTCTNHTHSHS